MPREAIHHPIQAAIDDIWNAGHTPRLQIDARRKDVVVPEFVKAKWGARLVLDLDASWPLNFEANQTGVQVDLAFQGTVTRCTLPWESIYVVLDRSTGRGFVIEAHVPEDGADESAKAAPRPKLREVSTAAEKTEKPDAEKPAGETRSDEEARQRRARFKVIDGGQ
jgi:stringent starvation protein B